MPLEHYGVLKGSVVEARREEDADTPHYQVHVNADGTSYRIAVNVKSQMSPSELLFLVDDRFQHPLTAGLPGLPHGFTELQREPGSLALDFIRGNLFDRLRLRPLPPNLPGPDNDLSDRVEHFVARASQEDDSEVYAFGERWGAEEDKPDKIFGFLPGNGIHDIHMNQGNVGPHAGDNGVFHDGGLILAFPDRLMGLFLAFQSQLVPTDAAGNAATGALTIEQILTGTPSVPTPLVSTIYIERALINPGGADPGLETVVLGNLSTTPQTLANWRLLDKNGRTTSINATLAPGASLIVALDGAGVQLGNNGGNLILQDETNAQVDVVTYTGEDAASADRYVRFRR